MGKVGLKGCFKIACTRSNGLLLVSNNKRCNDSVSGPAEFWLSSRTFARDLDLHISFTSRIALRKRSKFVTFPKTLKRKPGQKKWKGEKFVKAKKYYLTLCFSWQSFWSSLSPFLSSGEVARWPFPRISMDLFVTRHAKEFSIFASTHAYIK